jgi:hypothetical protein
VRVRILGGVAGGVVLGALAFMSAATAGAVASSARPAQVVTTTAAPTTTTLAPTTTTLAPTTTTLPPTTSTSTSTSSSTSTTTTTVATSKPSGTSNVPWALLIAALVLIAAALIAALIVSRRNAAKAKTAWVTAAGSALRDAELTRDQLEGEARPGEPEDPVRRRTVTDNVNGVSARFDQLAAQAPNDDARARATSVAESLRGYLFALEAEQLLRSAPTPPTPNQLADADTARRSRAADLDRALGALREYVDPEGAATQQP